MAVPIEPEEDREDASPADLMSYLSTILQQIELANGGDADTELRAKLDILKETISQPPPPSSESMNEVEVVEQLVQLEGRLNSLAARMASIEPGVNEFLSSTANLWVPVIARSTEERRQNQSGQSGDQVQSPRNSD